jgi:hypothetical protein
MPKPKRCVVQQALTQQPITIRQLKKQPATAGAAVVRPVVLGSAVMEIAGAHGASDRIGKQDILILKFTRRPPQRAASFLEHEYEVNLRVKFQGCTDPMISSAAKPALGQKRKSHSCRSM